MSLDGGLRLLSIIVRDGGQRPIAVIARDAGIPLSTAQRWVAAFERHQLLVQGERGRRVAGAGLVAMTKEHSLHASLRGYAMPLLRQFANAHSVTVHLGIWDGEMVTYVAKASAGEELFTRENMKLEGYCTAIGKVLLAHLGSPDRDAYIAAGPFVSLTERTIVLPVQLRAELAGVLRQGYALDQEEVQKGLFCFAVPIRDASGTVQAALSVSSRAGEISFSRAEGRAEIVDLAHSIERLMFHR